eukprot:TRINITY_DN60736_c0_g1_i1.p1 TRINITY_DN60736_c0_g1~~TRINITY_DN60736_c0_g1_i1.p1  ORF type:complete len:419 (+),score=78.33 TRINITY_DN60736_c0_g1_i1:46-1257(+)
MPSRVDSEAHEDVDSTATRLGSFPLKVKNTFLDIEDDLDEIPTTRLLEAAFKKRQVSEPPPSMVAALGEGIAGELFGFQSRWIPPGLTEEAEGVDAEPMRVQTISETVDSLAAEMARLAGAMPGAEAEASAAGQSFLGEGSPLHSIMTGAISPPRDWAGVTTIMMRNLPNKYTQRMLLTEINHTGFLGTFDFLYLPIDPETMANRGYAFVNFIDPGFAWMFRMSYEGRKMSRFNSNKVVAIVAATLQGFEANYAHYASARVNRGDPSARPLFLKEPKHPLAAATSGSRRGGADRRRHAHGHEQVHNHKAGAGAADAWMASHYGYEGDLFGHGMPYAAASPGMFHDTAGVGCFDMEAAGGSPPHAESGTPKFCPHCGGRIQPRFQFCPSCGASLDFLTQASLVE